MKTAPAQTIGGSTKAWVRALEKTAPIERNPTITLPVLIDDLAIRFGDTVALISDHGNFTYNQLARRSHQYTRWALNQGLVHGDVVALMMPNCPEYLAIWLGLTRVGAIVALINTNLVEESLAHAINTVAPKHVIVGAALSDTLTAVRHRLDPATECWTHGDGGPESQRLDCAIEQFDSALVPACEHPLPTITDRALYIYTSGTTGMPKAANVSHFRVMQWAHWFAGLMNTKPGDRMYDCLPMYHSVGGVVALGSMLVNGGSVVIRERFSASRFWDDVVELNCTLFQYIGELCRYLVNSPAQRREAEHRLRLCCGNGLRADIWERFQRRFRIPQILEFYAATEGNFSLYNCEGKPGAIGRIPPFLAHRYPMAILKTDLQTGEPLTNAEGFAIRCAANEAGEAVGKIVDDGSHTARRFEGYTEGAASEKKILRNLFTPGDAWYRTGDLMRRDEKGYYYFIDRLGDTFRWKGENVSTTEVAETIAGAPGVIDAVVCGVPIPGTEGRAGMAGIVAAQGFDLAGLHQHLVERLPEYARPLFIRLVDHLDLTTTFKAKKQDLVREGYNPAASNDPIYFNDAGRHGFVRLDAVLFERIQSGQLRL